MEVIDYLPNLQQALLFQGLDAEDLLKDVQGRICEFADGELIFEEGQPNATFYTVLEGSIKIFRIIKGQEVFIINHPKGDSIGEVPILGGKSVPVCGRAIGHTLLYAMTEEQFWQMMANCSVLRGRILANNAQRSETLELMQYQREKLVSLGTMAAGLAHELNNPATAATRASQALEQLAKTFAGGAFQFVEQLVKGQPGCEQLQVGSYEAWEGVWGKIKLDNFTLDALTRSDMEEELESWFDTLDIPNAAGLASTFVSVGLNRSIFESFLKKVPEPQWGSFLGWLTTDVRMRQLSHDVSLSASRISSLVQAVKSYSYMDNQDELQEVDLHEGLNNTLTMMGFKLKGKNVQVIREFDEDLPHIMGHGSELNQVWTNLIDNAIDALPEKNPAGANRIIIRTADLKNNCVQIDIIDNGSGIPEEIQNRIFDAFFTTKDVGKGTGLGLEISHRIIVTQHNGNIRVISRPGETDFQITLAIR